MEKPFRSIIQTSVLRASLLPLSINIVATLIYAFFIFFNRDAVSSLDWLDFSVEFISALTYVFLFWIVFVVRLPMDLRFWFASSILIIQFGRITDAADEIVTFSSAYASTMGDALTLTGEVILATSLLRWLFRTSLRANTDPLTGLFNRRFHINELRRLIRSAENSGLGFAVLALDLDNFKSINDRYGHTVGDQAIKSVADIVRINCRTIDTVSRVGGEEFEVLLPSCGDGQAQVIAERLRVAIETNPPYPLQSLSCSIGITLYQPGKTEQDLRDEADEALYASKRLGRNRITTAWAMPPSV